MSDDGQKKPPAGLRRRRVFGSVTGAREPTEQDSMEQLLDHAEQEIQAVNARQTAAAGQLEPESELELDTMDQQEEAPEAHVDLREWIGDEYISAAGRRAVHAIPQFMQSQYPNLATMAAVIKQRQNAERVIVRPEDYPTPYLALGAARWEQNKAEADYKFHRFGVYDGQFTKYHRTSVRFQTSGSDNMSRDVDRAYKSLKIDRDMLYKDPNAGILNGRLTPHHRRQQKERLSKKIQREKAINIGLRSFLLRGKRMMLR